MPFRRALPLIPLLLLAAGAFALESRLVDSSGRPVSGAQISVVGQSGSWRTGADGRFTITPPPRLPATLVVVGSRGEIFPPIQLVTAAAELRLEPAYRETVTVTTGATPNIEGTPAAAPVVLGFEEIEQRKPSHVSEAVAGLPGVSIRGEGAPAVPVIRGLAGGRTLLLIDDARIVSERRAGPSASFLDPLSLGSIEVSRGPGSVAYGSDAVGGVVHMRPRDPVPGSEGVRYDVVGTFGGVRAQSAAVEVTADAAGGALLASVHARSAGEGEDARGRRIVNSQYRDRGALLRFVRDASWGRFRAGLMNSVARDVGAPSSEAVRTTYPDERATLATFAADVESPGGWTSVSLRASAGSSSVTTERDRGTAVESSTVRARDASLRLSGERALGASRLVTGIDYVTRFDLRATGAIDDAARYDAGVFVSWDGSVAERLQLALGSRADAISTRNRGGHFGDRSTDDFALSGHAALTATPRRDVTATFQIASGFREPLLSDRFYRGVSGRGFITGNPDLEPERTRQLDGGVRWTGPHATMALYVYDYEIRNLVERYREGTDFFFRNRGEAHIRGAELEVTTRLPRNLVLQAGAAIARGEDAASGEPLDDIGAPALHTSLRWAAERASAFATLSAFARDDRPGPVEAERPGHATVDLGVGWRLLPHLELRLVLRNAGNRLFRGSPDENAAWSPGRSIMIGLNR